MKRFVFAALLAALALSVTAQPTIVGEHVPANLSTNHPYITSGSEEPTLSRTDVISYPNATYIAPHFATFQLGPGDFVIIRSPDHKHVWRYTGLGRGGYGMSTNGFFATHIKGDTAIIELWTAKGEAGYGYQIDFYGRGYSDEEIQEYWDMGLGEEMNLPEPPGQNRSLCTTDDTREAKCYQSGEPDAYDTSRAVCRLLLNGSAWCTGWLIGCDGHIMTNEHCIGSQADANNIDFEFMAEGANCSTNCASSLACPGTIEASGGTLVAVDAALDYALVMPDTSAASGTDLPATYGYMRLRASGAVVGERLYIPQHPAGWGKRIALESTYPGDTSGYPQVVSTNETACSGGPGDVGYWADTQGGSSGSPVLGYADNLVIALHHCRGSAFCSGGNPSSDDPNRGVPIEAVISDLGANLPNCATCTPPAAPANPSAAANGNNQIDVAWNAVSGATGYSVYRAQGSCPQGSYTLLASGLTATSYSDTAVSGGVTYAYVLTATSDNCESDQSACADATAVGICSTPPTFAGLLSVTDLQQATCALQLDWAAGTANCGTSVVYNIYRSTTSGFTPSVANMIQSCLTGTGYTDTDVSSGTTYYYIVRAEDNSGNGSGPCAGGIEDGNSAEMGGSPNGPGAFSDDMESGPGQWNVVSDTGSGPWSIVTTQSNSPTSSWFVADPSTITDQSVETASDINVIANATLEFYHWYNTESTYDGGVLEYSTNSGATWQDIGSGNFIQNGYNSTISTSYSNPIGGRAAWSGNSGGFVQSIVDISGLAGSSVRFRFRFASDTSVSATGWWVDDVLVTGGSCSSTGCTYSINPTSANYTSSGGSGSVSVTAPAGCAWTANSNDGWITVTSGSSGSGNGSVGYSVAANASTSARAGTITIAGNTFTVNQDGISCSYSISPTSAGYTEAGGSGSVSVTTLAGCNWSATSNDAWITVTSGSSGTGNGTVGYSVAANASTSARTGTITIAGNTFTVNQDGASCSYSISPTSADYADAGGNGSVSVTTQAGCNWTATSNDAWITVTSGSSGTGSGTVGYSVAANGSAGARTGTITIAGNTFTVNQDGVSGWVEITNDDFEAGWGSYSDGGSDCRRSANDARYAHQGTFCVRLRDNTSTSNFTSTNNMDLSAYSQLRVVFWYLPVSFEGSEDFFLEYSSDGGSSWTVIGNWVNNVDFTNNNFENPTVIVNTGTISFTTTAKIRVRCDASGNGDRVYIDEVVVSAQ